MLDSDQPFDEVNPAEQQRRWLMEIDAYEREFGEYEKRCNKIRDRYLDERKTDQQNTQRRFNILWSTVQTVLPSVYAQTPKAEIERRNKDKDPVGRAASEILERCANYSLECDDFDQVMESDALDYLLSARACAWVRYVPHTRPQEPMEPGEGEEAGESGAPDDIGNVPRELVYEEAPCDYIHRQDFLHSLARTWIEVWWVARRVYMDRPGLIKRFGEKIGKNVPLDSWPANTSDEQRKSGKYDHQKKACIYEVWCKSNRKVYWISKGYSEGPLDVKEDWLKLRDFFPCPRPAYGTLSNDSLVPVPDYYEYQDLAEQLDDLSQRIKCIADSIKAVGIYDASMTGLKRIMEEGSDFKLIPVEQWAMTAEKGGIKGVISWWPIEDIVGVLENLYKAFEVTKQNVYEITGWSDIMRGASEATETATAQQIKANYGSIRLRKNQREIQRFARDIVRIKSEIIAEHFQPDTLMLMSNIQLPSKAQFEQEAQMALANGQQPQPPKEPFIEDVVSLLRNDGLRGFRIDIETDSTIQADQQQEKQSRNEFVAAIGAYMQQAVPLAQTVPQMAPLLSELMMFAVRGFGGSSRQLEQTFEQTMDDLAQARQQAAEQPKEPTPEEKIAEMGVKKEEIGLKVAEIKGQAEIARANAETEKGKAEMQAQVDQAVAPVLGQAIQQASQMMADAMGQSNASFGEAIQQLTMATQAILNATATEKEVEVVRDNQGRVVGARSRPSMRMQ